MPKGKILMGKKTPAPIEKAVPRNEEKRGGPRYKKQPVPDGKRQPMPDRNKKRPLPIPRPMPGPKKDKRKKPVPMPKDIKPGGNTKPMGIKEKTLRNSPDFGYMAAYPNSRNSRQNKPVTRRGGK